MVRARFPACGPSATDCPGASKPLGDVMNRNTRSMLFSGTAVVFAPLALVSAASAQNTQPVTAATASPATAAAATGAGQPAVEQLQEVTVTGSRVITNNSNSPTPIMAVSTDQLQAARPGPLANSVNLLPVFSGSRGLTSNPGIGATGVQGGNGVADVLNLRNLGAYRTLVLFDGQRIPPTLFNGVVDGD